MANFNIQNVQIEANQISGGNYWFFIYDAEKMKLKKDTQYVEPDSTSKTATKYTIFASDTEQGCIDEQIRLGLT
jgi:hypothetical protein